MPELHIALDDGGNLNFDQSLLHFNVKNIYVVSYFKRTF